MSAFYDMALDAGFRGEEADIAARIIEEQEMERRHAADLDAHYADLEAQYAAEQERDWALWMFVNVCGVPGHE